MLYKRILEELKLYLMNEKKNEKNHIFIPTEPLLFDMCDLVIHIFRFLKVVNFVELLKLFPMVCEMIAEKI